MSSSEKYDEIQGKIVHEYDGILEADNVLPNWWLATLFLTIVFGGMYWSYYEAFGIGLGPRAEYAAEVARRATAGGPIDEQTLNTLATNSDLVAAGQQKFAQNCVACHGANAGGSIGPNLTDNAWIHGGTALDIYQTVQNGVGAKGMPAWGAVLGEASVQSLVAYVLTLRNTNVAGGKAPEGSSDQVADAEEAPSPHASDAGAENVQPEAVATP